MTFVFQILVAFSVLFCLGKLEPNVQHALHLYVPLRLIAQLLSASWAAWDSTRIKLETYKTPMSHHPLVIFIVCLLLWIVGFPLYLYSRYKAVTNQAPRKFPTTQQDMAKTKRLALFALACLVLGAGILFCMFAPNINPSFINDCTFQHDLRESLPASALRRASGEERAVIDKIRHSMEHEFSPDDFKQLGLSVPEQVTFPASDGNQLHGWYFKTPGATDTVLFSWSGMGDQRVAATLGYFKLLQEAKLDIFAYDYRGFGASKGKSKLQTAVPDGVAAYDYLVQHEKVDPQHLILMGRQIGAYVSCQLSKEHACKALVLEEPWTTLKDYVDSIAVAMRMIPVSLYPENGLDNLAVLKQKHPPLLVVGSAPRSSAYAIFKQIDGPKNFVHIIEFDNLIAPDFSFDSQRYGAKIIESSNGVRQVPAISAVTPAVMPGSSVVAEIPWQGDFEKALAAARQENKLVLIDVYTDWCTWCKRLDEDTYSDSDVQKLVNQHYIALKVNAEKPGSGQTVANRYHISGFPTVLAVDGDGRIRGKITGYLPPTLFLQQLESFAY